ncbi:hypothetical protein quinque_005654 [Culex quinquefasciatus]
MIAIVVMIQGKVPRKIVFKSKIGTSSASVRTCAVCVKKENPSRSAALLLPDRTGASAPALLVFQHPRPCPQDPLSIVPVEKPPR